MAARTASEPSLSSPAPLESLRDQNEDIETQGNHGSDRVNPTPIASTNSDRMPAPCDAKKRWSGKRNAVTLVVTVLTRKSAVQPSSRFPTSSPNTTTNPEKIPIKLSTTCTKVNVVMPKIMMPVPSKPRGCYDAATEIATHADQPGFQFCFPVGRKLTPNTVSTQCAGAWDRLLNWLALGLSKGTVFDFSSLSLLRPLFPK